MKHVVVQLRALRDLEDARAWYAEQAPHMTPGFASAVDEALRHLKQQGATGSPKYGMQLGMTGLRSWPLSRFPYLVLSFDHNDRITVARVLHQARDIPAHLKN